MSESKDLSGPQSLYEKHVNPQWVRLLDVLGMNVRYASCLGAELVTEDGRHILDFNSGYCVHNIGHNHPGVVRAIRLELERNGPAMLQGQVPELAGEPAERLCMQAGGRLSKVFFCSSGSEGVEAVIKFARANTKRPGILYASGGFHGLTCGALSLMDNPFWTAEFGPLLPETRAVPFGDFDQLEKHLSSKRFGAFITEPIQAEAGVLLPPPNYLSRAQDLCRRYGTLFALDEVQTGMCRTRPFLAAHQFGVEPDMVVLAKALSGGLVPSGAVLMSDAVYNSVYTSFKRSIIHTSTYSENGLSMRAGLATMEVLAESNLGERGAQLGSRLLERLTSRLARYDMIKEIRGLGMMSGIEFRPPKRLRLRILFEAFAKIHPAMFGQVLVMRLFRDGAIYSQICGNNFMVLKIAPALVIDEPQLDRFVEAIEATVDLMHSSSAFWTEALWMARRVKMSFSIRALVLAAVLMGLACDASSAEYQSGTLTLEPSKTQIEFRLPGVLHTTHGTFKLERGVISGDLDTGQAHGLIVVDPASGDSGIGARDDRMKNGVLEVQKYPEVTFAPKHISGQLANDDQFRGSLLGILTLHGTDHSIAMEVQGRLIGDSLVAKSHFLVPYVEWGMEDPSVIFLTVAKNVDIDVATEGHIVWSNQPSPVLPK